MRSDIVPGAIFPNYELSDHTAKRRKLSELQGQPPIVLVLTEVSAPRIGGSMKGLLPSIVNSWLAIAGLSRLAPTISLSVSRIRIWDFRFPILDCGADSNRGNIEAEADYRPDRTIKEANE
jgi:hypothetical protein